MPEMTPAKATALRKPFPPESVGQLPKGGVMLDYVGHAAVTDRLLTVDPEWTWEPLALDSDGLPAPDGQGNLWIRLTVCGVSRIGVGDGKNAKERIGDAIRNAAMRFGVALDLWAKENLVEFAHAASAPAPPPEDPWQPAIDEANRTTTVPLLDTKSNLAKAMYAAINEAGIPEEERIEQVSLIIDRKITSTKEMTQAEARKVLNHLSALRSPAPPEPEAAS